MKAFDLILLLFLIKTVYDAPTELPKYGNITVTSGSTIYLNLASIKKYNKIYIQIQLLGRVDYIKQNLKELKIYAFQNDLTLENSVGYQTINFINSNYKENGNSSLTFYFNFTKSKNFLMITFGNSFSYTGVSRIYVKHTKNNELIVENKSEKMFILVSSIIIVIIFIFVFLYIFIYIPLKKGGKEVDEITSSLNK